MANAGPDQTVEQTTHQGAYVCFDGSGSYDLGGEPLLAYQWTWLGNSVTGLTPCITLPLGQTVVTLTVSNGVAIATDTVTITVVDTESPVICCPPDLTVEQSSHEGTQVNLGKPCVTDTCDPDPDVTCNAPALFPPGETVVTWTAMDGSDNSATCTQTVTVVDTKPPLIKSIKASPDILCPSIFCKLEEVSLTVEAEDICDSAPTCEIIKIESNQQEKPWLSPDWEIAGDLALRLRAETDLCRWENRVYTITVECTDISGNKSTAITQVKVVRFLRRIWGRGNEDLQAYSSSRFQRRR